MLVWQTCSVKLNTTPASLRLRPPFAMRAAPLIPTLARSRPATAGLLALVGLLVELGPGHLLLTPADTSADATTTRMYRGQRSSRTLLKRGGDGCRPRLMTLARPALLRSRLVLAITLGRVVIRHARDRAARRRHRRLGLAASRWR